MTLTTRGRSNRRRRHSASRWETRSQGRIFRYVLLVTTVVFCNRALPMPFLPLVLEREFRQPQSIIGLVVAVYPVASLLGTSWATSLSRRTDRIVALHSVAVLCIAFTTLLFGLSERLLRVLSLEATMAFVVISRALQGVANALYLAANTTLVTRNFGEQVPYVIGMAEVAVGMGAQIGRIVGGILYDQGGFACPFLIVVVIQILCAVLGFSFAEATAAPESPSPGIVVRPIPWRTLATPRMAVAAMATLLNYLLTGFYDSTLPLHLEKRFGGDVSVTLVGGLYAMRSISYMLVCYVCAQLMASKRASVEALIGAGSLAGLLGLLFIAPQAFVGEALGFGTGTQAPTDPGPWALQIVALVVSSAGCALLLVPSLPLMQQEASQLSKNPAAVEQVTGLFMTMLSLGEASGPVIGGWAAGLLSFRVASGMFSVIFGVEAAAAACGLGSVKSSQQEPVEDDFASPLLRAASPGGSGPNGTPRAPRWCHASPG